MSKWVDVALDNVAKIKILLRRNPLDGKWTAWLMGLPPPKTEATQNISEKIKNIRNLLSVAISLRDL